jgi:hypothetical protein
LLLLISADPKEHGHDRTRFLPMKPEALLVVRGRFARVLTRPHNRHCRPEEN